MDQFSSPAFLIFLLALGAIIGSFLNVVIVRTRAGESFGRGRSHCPLCGRILGALELVPVVSFIIQKGRCRGCGKSVSWQYPAVEAATAILFLICGLIWLASPDAGILTLIRNLAFVCFSVLIFVYDLRWQEIPDSFSLPAVAAIFILNLFIGMPAWSMVLGAAIAGGFFALQFLLSKGRWIGGGDIRLGALMGVLLGWQLTLLSLLLAYVGGAVISVLLMAFAGKKMDSQVAFGTFLVGAALVALFWGRELINLYLRLT